ncbi:hypothetical protein LIER_36050 [Lithospermum erythrorhizon]|uniref:Uncharacterized protein n=1 Tax=Lithospermum erythrorhizon TaxID=34254 RepID=A0AAV3NZZ8_LITER
MSPQSMLKHVFSRKMALLRSITSDLESTINRIFQLAAATQPLQVLQTMQRRTGYGLQICIVPNILRDTVEIVRANDMLTSPILLHEGYKFDPADSAYVFPRPLDFILRMDDFEGFKDASQFVLSEPGKQWVLYAAQKIDVYLQNLLDSFGNIRSDGNPASLRHILDRYSI